ncbi:hypothetical protein GGR89_001254 [Sphingomonas trueperi]|uniref:Uncharacterized protein n=1 Tax=Sphingomonas trueperi TaxID=53317 RepID=A0A7X6BBW7_9SPHN|nr:hypothetical protein [Sphingomonas trueperi]
MLFTDRIGSAALEADIEASIIGTRQTPGAGWSKHPYLP